VRQRVRSHALRATLIDIAIATVVVLLIASPLLFTSDGFAPDFTNAIWFAGSQQRAIAAHLHPTLFLHTQQLGVFYPQFAFYGGTLFGITGALGALLGGSAVGGSTIAAFEIVTLGAIAAAYGGIFWLGRQLGVKGVLAHAPAIVFVTSAYYVTDLYGRGAWAEFMAVSALPLMLAATLRLVRGPWRFWPAACLVAASVVFTGSHNITVLAGSTVAVLALACYWLLSGCTRALPWRRIGATAALIALGVALNGWFLLPDVRYAHDTMVGGGGLEPRAFTAGFNTAGVIFDPLRTVPAESATPALYVQAPVLALAWGLFAAPLYWRERRLRAGLATALIVVGGLLWLIMSSGAWSALPTPYRRIQFPYRLQSYVALACAGLVLLGVLALTRRAQSGRATRADRRLALGLVLAVAFGLALCAWQLWIPNTHIYNAPTSYADRGDALSRPPTLIPDSWSATEFNYRDRSLPALFPAGKFDFYAGSVENDRLSGPVPFPAGLQPFATNIAGGPYLVRVGGGVRVVGRTQEGYLVLKRTTRGSRRVNIKLSSQLSAPVVLGRITTAGAAVLLLSLAVAAALRRRRSTPHP
jgi:hypothetical protein